VAPSSPSVTRRGGALAAAASSFLTSFAPAAASPSDRMAFRIQAPAPVCGHLPRGGHVNQLPPAGDVHRGPEVPPPPRPVFNFTTNLLSPHTRVLRIRLSATYQLSRRRAPLLTFECPSECRATAQVAESETVSGPVSKMMRMVSIRSHQASPCGLRCALLSCSPGE
jgi:hypothetical protein